MNACWTKKSISNGFFHSIYFLHSGSFVKLLVVSWEAAAIPRNYSFYLIFYSSVNSPLQYQAKCYITGEKNMRALTHITCRDVGALALSLIEKCQTDLSKLLVDLLFCHHSPNLYWHSPCWKKLSNVIAIFYFMSFFLKRTGDRKF